MTARETRGAPLTTPMAAPKRLKITLSNHNGKRKNLKRLALKVVRFRFRVVEMAGVEPASPGLSAETSTRLAARLDFGVSWGEGARNRLSAFPSLTSRERRQGRGFTCFFDSPAA